MTPARYILCDEPWRPEYRRADALRRGFGEMMLASVVTLLGQGSSVLMVGHRDWIFLLAAFTLGSGMFVFAAVRNFSQAEKGLRAIDLRSSKLAFLVSVLVAVSSIAAQWDGLWTVVLLSISVSTWLAFLGFYLQRRARSATTRVFPILWYATLMVAIVSFLSILLSPIAAEGLHPNARFMVHASDRELNGFLLLIGFLASAIFTPISAIFFGFTWDVMRQQMRSGVVPNLESPQSARMLSDEEIVAFQQRDETTQ